MLYVGVGTNPGPPPPDPMNARHKTERCEPTKERALGRVQFHCAIQQSPPNVGKTRELPRVGRNYVVVEAGCWNPIPFSKPFSILLAVES